MLSEDTKDYIETWKKRIDGINGEKVDYFFSLFECEYKIFGRLNIEATNQLIAASRPYNLGDDQISATEVVAEYLTIDLINKSFNESNADDIADLINVLPLFNIKFNKRNEHLSDVDEQLLRDLKSADAKKRTLAISKVIYFVRCNIEHSRKRVEDYQQLLLEPLINLLKTLNGLLLDKLSK